VFKYLLKSVLVNYRKRRLVMRGLEFKLSWLNPNFANFVEWLLMLFIHLSGITYFLH
jgi:hypothetical protein